MEQRQATTRISEILLEFARGLNQPRVTLGELSQLLGDRAFGFLLLLFALPNVIVLASIPGFSTVMGVPLMLIGAQMVLGRERPQLPKLVNERSLSSNDFRRFVEKSARYLKYAEQLLRPRLAWLTAPLAERLLGAHCVLMAFLLALPIPFGNLLPASSICLVALGLVERDGAFVLAGIGVGIATVVVLASIVTGMVVAFLFALSQI